MNASGGVPGWCNESRVTCMKNYAWWLCHKYDVNYMIMQWQYEKVKYVMMMMNGTVESCMAIYLGMAMERRITTGETALAMSRPGSIPTVFSTATSARRMERASRRARTVVHDLLHS